MKKMLVIVFRCVLACAVIWLLCVLLVWAHAHSRLDVEEIIVGVSHVLNVQRSKLVPLNEPCKAFPNLIVECVEDRADLLGRCTTIVPLQAEISHLSAKDQNFVREALQREYEQTERGVRGAFKKYNVELKGDVKNLYSIKETPAESAHKNLSLPMFAEAVVVETDEHMYIVVNAVR